MTRRPYAWAWITDEEMARMDAMPMPWEEETPTPYPGQDIPMDEVYILWRCKHCGGTSISLTTCPHCGGPSGPPVVQ